MLVTTSEGLQEMVEYLSGASFFAFDVETIGITRIQPWANNVCWISLSDGFRHFSVPMSFPNGELLSEEYPLKDNPDLQARMLRGLSPRKSDYSTDRSKVIRHFSEPPPHLTKTEVFGALKPLMMDDRITKVGHNLPFDLGSVAKYVGGIPVGPYADTMIAAFLISGDRFRGMGLKDVAARYAEIEMQKGVGADVSIHTFDDVHKYAELDAEATAKAWIEMKPILEKDQLMRVFSLEMDVVPVITSMKLRGAMLDKDLLLDLQEKIRADLNVIEKKIYEIADRRFSLTSNAEKQHVLYAPVEEGGQGLECRVFTPGGKEKAKRGDVVTIADYSVSSDALERHRGNPLVDALLDHAVLAKLLGTYVNPYLKEPKPNDPPILDQDNRIHTNFNATGAATGRFSSSNPNLQNVPNSRTEYGKIIRQLFIAPPGHTLVVADYSQIEPRLIAAMSKDPTMVKTYETGGDVYTAIGDQMGVDRAAGKVLVLSMAYGVGPDKIATSIGCTKDEAEELLKSFDVEFPNIKKLKNRVVTKARERGREFGTEPFVQTLLGRRRYLPDLDAVQVWRKDRAKRQAFNTVIQGSAADIMKKALVNIHLALPEGSYITLTVHDEVVVVTPEDMADETAAIVKAEMEGSGFSNINVPLIADVKYAQNWGDAK
jgi:DNA polymerase I-like protein with 3'-5' exonuclease and polymerase domains